MNDGRLTQIRSEWATAKGWYPAGLGGYSYEMTVAIIDNAHAAITDLLQALADAETRAALLTRALYDEVRHPINVKGGTWTDEEIRFYLSAKWGLTTPRPDAETRAARLAAADNIAHMSPLYGDVSSEEVVVLRCVFCEGQEDGMNRVFLHADDCPWQALAATPRPDAGQGEG